MNSINSPLTLKLLDISTGHMSKKDEELLHRSVKGDEAWMPIVYKYEEGYFVYVPGDCVVSSVKELQEHGFSDQFVKIIKKAATLGIKYVQFDADGTEYDDLKTFDW